MNGREANEVGFLSSTLVATLGVAYVVLLIVYLVTGGQVYPPSPLVQLVGGIVTFFSASSLLVVFVAIRCIPDKGDNVFGVLGMCFAALFSLSVSINRFVQLTVIRLSPSAGASPDLARFLPYAADSVMFALEMLGWGFFSSVAALFIAPLFRGNRLEGSIRRMLLLYALVSLSSVVGYAAGSALVSLGFLAWGPILTVIAILMARFFFRCKCIT